MARRSIAELLTQADTTVEDNAVGAISPADVRNLVKDFLDTMRPSYMQLRLTTEVESITGAPVAIAPWDIQDVANTAEWQGNITNGTITRALNGVAGNSTRITVDIDAEGPNNNLITFSLYKNGAPSGFEVSATLLGAGRPVSVNFAGLAYNTVDTTFTLVAFGDVGSVTFSNGLMLCENVPVASFV